MTDFLIIQFSCLSFQFTREWTWIANLTVMILLGTQVAVLRLNENELEVSSQFLLTGF